MNRQDVTGRSAKQTFLVGDTIYFRPVELDDARTAPAWQPKPFPAPAEVVEEQLKERLEVDDPDVLHERMLLIACRKDNDQPVGSVEIVNEGWRFGEILPRIDPLATAEEQAALIAEYIRILVPWMLDERHLMTVTVEDAGVRSAVAETAASMGGRLTTLHRKALLIRGERVDASCYQFFNARWLEKMGPPAEPVFGPVERETIAPARPRMTATIDDRPDDAIVLGKRVYLRAVKPEEGALVAQWALEETELPYPEGRLVFSPHGFAHAHKRIAEQDPPELVRFAIVLRDSGEMIGCNGLCDISWVHGRAETETEIFRPQHRNAGYGTEAKHLLLEYAFERLGLHMIYSYVAETNPRSSAALVKQGYREAGLIAWDSLCKDGLCGYLTYDLLASEWRDARDRAAGSFA